MGQQTAYETVSLAVVAEHAAIGACPYRTVAGGEESVDDAVLLALQTIRAEDARLTVEASHTIMGANPQTACAVVGERAHIVVGENGGRVSITAVVERPVTIIAQQSLLSAHPHHALSVKQQTTGSHRTSQWGLRHFSQHHILCRCKKGATGKNYE